MEFIIMKKKTFTTSIGTMNLNQVEFIEDSLDIIIGIESVSADIHKKINDAIEIAKAKRLDFIRKYYINRDLNWTDAGVNTLLSLGIHLKKETITCTIDIIIEDMESDISADASIEVDLSEYQNELKKIIVKAMIDKFF